MVNMDKEPQIATSAKMDVSPKTSRPFSPFKNKGHFQDQFLISHSFMSNAAMEMILTGCLVP